MKNLSVNYCCPHESAKGCAGKKFGPSILRIGKIQLIKGKFKKILVLLILKLKFCKILQIAVNCLY